jgi:hypothetical protein
LDPACKVLEVLKRKESVVLLVTDKKDAQVPELEGEVLVRVDLENLGEAQGLLGPAYSFSLFLDVLEDAGV